jgi:hypothetical protein
MPSSLRLDRDRYVAFAFAAADMLLELDQVGCVVSANGAVRVRLRRGSTAGSR